MFIATPPPSPSPRPPPPPRRQLVCAQRERAPTSKPPKSIRDAVTQLREALQSTLHARISRACITMPLDAKYGVEASVPARHDGTQESTRQVQQRSNRELARLLVGMFETSGLDVRVIFGAEAEAREARRLWPDAIHNGACRVTCSETPRRRQRAVSRGFGGGGGASDAPGDAVLMYVAPRDGAHTQQVRAASAALGVDTLVLVLNAPPEARASLGDHFHTTYFYRQPAHALHPHTALYRKFPDAWCVVKQSDAAPLRALGMGARIVLRTEAQPTREEIEAALDKV